MYEKKRLSRKAFLNCIDKLHLVLHDNPWDPLHGTTRFFREKKGIGSNMSNRKEVHEGESKVKT